MSAVPPGMRIGLTVGRGTTGGIARYARELYGALAGRGDIEVVPIGSAAALEQLDPVSGDRWVVPATNQVTDALYVRYLLRRHLRRLGVDVLHGTRHLLPRASPCPTVLTVHDLFAFDRREEFPLLKRWLVPYWYRRSLEEADALLCVSDATRVALDRHSSSWSRKATTVRSAVHTALMTSVSQPPARDELRDFALVVGDLSPRKNITLLLQIWPIVFREVGLKLVIVGPNGWRNEGILGEVHSLVRQGYAVRRENLPEGELRGLYEAARMVLCPSLAEGWGFPVQEALAFDTPVIAGTDPGLAEAAGGRAILVNPGRPADWITAITCLARGDSRTTADRPGSNKRTWGAVADETVTMYRMLMGRTNRRVPRVTVASKQAPPQHSVARPVDD